MEKKYKNSKELILSMVAYSGASIFGPLIVIGGAGYFLDKFFETNSVILIISVFIAFIVTNILLFRKVKRINKMMEKYKKQAYQEVEEKVQEQESQTNSNQPEK